MVAPHERRVSQLQARVVVRWQAVGCCARLLRPAVVFLSPPVSSLPTLHRQHPTLGLMTLRRSSLRGNAWRQSGVPKQRRGSGRRRRPR